LTQPDLRPEIDGGPQDRPEALLPLPPRQPPEPEVISCLSCREQFEEPLNRGAARARLFQAGTGRAGVMSPGPEGGGRRFGGP
jgi:hypothetical protein